MVHLAFHAKVQVLNMESLFLLEFYLWEFF